MTKAHYLVLGGTGSIGYAVAQELLAQNEQVTLLVRNRQKAQGLFKQQPNLTIVEGDTKDLPLLKQLGAQATHIFHGINYPYNKWEGNMEEVTRNVIEAAAQNKATILFPGNVYNYGLTARPITETDHPNPNTREGAIRVRLEKLLQQAAAEGKCKVLLLRLPDFWGPNVTNEGVAPIFNGALTGKPMPWLVNLDIPHQLVYTPDAARVFYQLLQKAPSENFTLYNYGGEVVLSMRQLFQQIASLAGTTPRYKLYSKGFVRFMGLFIPVLRELKEMLYLYDQTIVLDDSKLKKALPGFRPTPLPEAIRTTLDWFREHYHTREELRKQPASGGAPGGKVRAEGLSTF